MPDTRTTTTDETAGTGSRSTDTRRTDDPDAADVSGEDHPGRIVRTLALRPGRLTWRRHPAVRSESELTFGERAADRMRNGMGSWAFVICALCFLAAWMVGNRDSGFDPYPFILLNLVLSCLAAMQGAILLIAARRSDQISAELAQHDYQTNLDAAGEIRELHAGVRAILDRLDRLEVTLGDTDTDTETVPGHRNDTSG